LVNICALPSGNLAECYRVHLGSASLEFWRPIKKPFSGGLLPEFSHCGRHGAPG
jgi:hypothetical protein